MKTLSLGIAFLLAICLAVLAACGGDNGDAELERALQSVTENDLAIMVLPQEDLGEEFADLEIDDDSGFVDNEQAADGTIDPDDTAEDLERAGRINGYDLTYSDPAFSALEAGEGVLSVGTGVDLFTDADAAWEFAAKQIDDYLRLEGEEIEAGITLEEVETFQVVGLPDDAVGLRSRISFGDAQMYGTFVGFRLDRVLGSATIARADDANVNSQVEEIARALEERIEGVLLGDIGGVPVPVPQAEEEATGEPGKPTPDVDRAEAMVLPVGDLPAGFIVDADSEQGFQPEADTIPGALFNYEKTYVSDGDPSWIQSEVVLFEDEESAQGFFRVVSAVLTSGYEDVGYVVERVDGETVGEKGLTLRLEYQTPTETLFGYDIEFLVGPVEGSLVVQGGDQAEVEHLATRLAQLMQDRIRRTLE